LHRSHALEPRRSVTTSGNLLLWSTKRK